MKGIKRFFMGLTFLAVSLLTHLTVVIGNTAVYEEAAPVSSLPSRVSPVRTKMTFEHPRNIPLFYGKASWYSQSDAGIKIHTANGEVFNDRAKTCAAWDIPFGSHLKVTNLANHKSVVCRVNDRGPNKRLDRKIDLSKASFRQIADTRCGIIKVLVELQQDR